MNLDCAKFDCTRCRVEAFFFLLAILFHVHSINCCNSKWKPPDYCVYTVILKFRISFNGSSQIYFVQMKTTQTATCKFKFVVIFDVVTVEERKIQYYDCCVEPWVTLTFSLQMKRKLVFSTFILTLPCIFLAFMTLVVFWLPPERPDRTGLGKCCYRTDPTERDSVSAATGETRPNGTW